MRMREDKQCVGNHLEGVGGRLTIRQRPGCRGVNSDSWPEGRSHLRGKQSEKRGHGEVQGDVAKTVWPSYSRSLIPLGEIHGQSVSQTSDLGEFKNGGVALLLFDKGGKQVSISKRGN